MGNIATVSLFFGKIIGFFLVIWALSLMVRRKECVEMVDNLRGNPTVLYAIALVTVLVGLILLIIHPVWIMGWPLIITIIGWAIVLSSLFCLFFPYNLINRLIEYFNRPVSYVVHGILSLAIGLYLIVRSFGWLGS